jgi:hypothetical protein
MKNLIAALYNVTSDSLEWNKDRKEHDDVPRHPPIFERDDNVYISAESEYSYLFADYYGEYRGGYAWINPDLEKVAENFGGYWEWENPGCIVFVR